MEKKKKATVIVDALCLKLCIFSEGCTFCVRPSAWGISIAQTASWLKLLEVIINNFVTALMSVQHCGDLMCLSRDRCVSEVSFLCWHLLYGIYPLEWVSFLETQTVLIQGHQWGQGSPTQSQPRVALPNAGKLAFRLFNHLQDTDCAD